MKKILLFSSLVAVIVYLCTGTIMTSCKKSSSGTPDSALFYFHLHTQIMDSTIGGNTGGADSNCTGNSSINYPWYFDSLGRHIELLVPQFFITNIQLVKSDGSVLSLSNAVLLKGLDSEDYYIGKAPIGTYVAAKFSVGLANMHSNMNMAMNFLTGLDPYPVASTMWNSAAGDYYGMLITGAYDTSIVGITGGTPVNPLPFHLAIPNALTLQYPVSLPVRTAPASQMYGIYVASAGSTNYVHLYCDYGKLLTAINLRTSNNTSTNPLIADSLAAKIPDMFRYEQ